jgi:hypothetical protein
MDPGACRKALDTALFEDENPQEVVDCCEALDGWLGRGGFMPVGPNGGAWRGKRTVGQLRGHLSAVAAAARLALFRN